MGCGDLGSSRSQPRRNSCELALEQVPPRTLLFFRHFVAQSSAGQRNFPLQACYPQVTSLRATDEAKNANGLPSVCDVLGYIAHLEVAGLRFATGLSCQKLSSRKQAALKPRLEVGRAGAYDSILCTQCRIPEPILSGFRSWGLCFGALHLA